ncbi:MAG: DNA repair protein RecN [Christensenellaceae bacterium]|nr:DNA repair protein RecN [Christensenellaceae bacterium]MDD7495490.1 DNA repair protein RecN [Christensenellaceae bacterium]MDY5718772.1 DNA repair protein RecN [Eubacteriales bacterium]
MLQSLYLENIALIEKLGIELFPGFNVLTGETGAGKSIIIDAVNFVLGERTSRDLIRNGAARAKVEAVFNLNEGDAAFAALDALGIEYDGNELILSRELSAAGRNACRVNGTLVPVASLKSVSDTLVDIHGQHEHQALLDAENHISYLDAYCHADSLPIIEKIDAIVSRRNELMLKRNSGFSSQREREREMDMLRYQIEEIASANLEVGEEERLSAEKTVLLNAERIRTALETAHMALSGAEEGSALSAIDTARRSMRDIAALNKDYEALGDKIEELYYAAEDISFVLRDTSENVESDMQRLEEIEQRLKLISDLKRKYGRTVEDVIDFGKDAGTKLNELENAEALAAELDAKLDKLKAEYNVAADELSKVRRAAGDRLKRDVLNELKDLGMAKAMFDVALSDASGGEPRKGGRETAEFMLSANPGEPLKPLEKVASGGELSRIMLCFKSIFADNDRVPTLIFDEIDTGISGRTAAVVGEKMLGIAKKHQVICVTHLAQIAALAEAHLMVRKYDDGKNTFVETRQLNEEEKVQRIAQMMDGESDSPSALTHARELIARADKIKEKTADKI